MQIKRIVLYSKRGQIRTVDFQLGAVNIITGRSRTGKTAIIDIIDYCLGRSSFKIFEGVNRESVAFYGIVLQIDEGQIFLAKPPPLGSAKSQSKVYMKIAKEITLPSLEELKPDDNDQTIISYLSRLLGISPNRTEPEEGRATKPFEATIDHTKYYLFQNYNLVSNPKLLFYRQDEEFIPQHIKDTIPYFLGAVNENRLQISRKLKDARRQLAIARRRLSEAESIVSKKFDKAQSLLAEAKEVGIINKLFQSSDFQNLLSALQKAAHWNPVIPLQEPKQLEESRQILQVAEREFNEKIHQVREVEAFIHSAQGYATEAEQQILRLQPIGLYDINNFMTDVCPVCLSKLSTPTPSVTAIAQSLEEMNCHLQGVRREQPRLHEHLENLKDELEELRTKVREARDIVNALVNDDEIAKRIKDSNAMAARVSGRISLYLENVDVTEKNTYLYPAVEEAEQLVNTLEKKLESDEVEEIKDSILNVISAQMTEWAKYLKHEYAGNPFRLDIKKLTVIADTPERPITMERMGSTENWLVCHLISLLSLHKEFIKRSRPVPNFLILDQPAQGYFLSKESYKALEGEVGNLEKIGSDAEAVQRMFNFLFDITQQLYPKFQIIIIEHVNLDDERYKNALVEEPWNGINALIPTDWID